MTQVKSNISPEEARVRLWHAGELQWLLHAGQKSLYDSYQACKEKTVVWNCSRRLGKSYSLCIIALETCLKKPNALVKYCCAKQVDARGIIRPLIRDIIESCPIELKPVFKVQEKAYVFPNGSRIELSGLDGGRAESIRGGSAELCIVDEAGLVGELTYIISSILLPTTITTHGKIILASTPPKSPSHDFCKYITKAEIEGNLITKTIYDNPLLDKDEIQKQIDECGGVESVTFRREYLCEIIRDSLLSVVPEWDDVKKECVREWPHPVFYDGYVGMDLGVKDLTVALFGYFDFLASKIIIEDEFVINGTKFNTSELAKGIKEKETLCYTDPVTKEQKTPTFRVSDNNLIVIQDLYQLHGLRFIPTRKDDKDSALNHMRILIQEKRIIIHPRCKVLIAHLNAAIWNKNKTEFARSGDNGHFDAVDSLLYLVRNVQFGKNPYPRGWMEPSRENQFQVTQNKPTPHADTFKTALNLNPKPTQNQSVTSFFNRKK